MTAAATLTVSTPSIDPDHFVLAELGTYLVKPLAVIVLEYVRKESPLCRFLTGTFEPSASRQFTSGGLLANQRLCPSLFFYEISIPQRQIAAIFGSDLKDTIPTEKVQEKRLFLNENFLASDDHCLFRVEDFRMLVTTLNPELSTDIFSLNYPYVAFLDFDPTSMTLFSASVPNGTICLSQMQTSQNTELHFHSFAKNVLFIKSVFPDSVVLVSHSTIELWDPVGQQQIKCIPSSKICNAEACATERTLVVRTCGSHDSLRFYNLANLQFEGTCRHFDGDCFFNSADIWTIQATREEAILVTRRYSAVWELISTAFRVPLRKFVFSEKIAKVIAAENGQLIVHSLQNKVYRFSRPISS
jgi:hypothetical protein